MVVAGVLWLVWHNSSRNTNNSPGNLITLAVLPFETRSSDADLAWFGEVLGEDLTFDTPQDADRAKTLALQALSLDERSLLALKPRNGS